MILTPPDVVAVAISVAVWVVASLTIGRWAVGWPAERLDRPGRLTSIKSWERHGRFWQRRFRVLRWKDRLPEAGAFFAGGQPKRHIGSGQTADLEAFGRETVRAERVHWLLMATGPAHLVWCRPTVGLGMIAFGVVFNLPFIVVQRTNRGRLDRLLDRRRQSISATP